METNLRMILDTCHRVLESAEKLRPLQLKPYQWVEIRLFLSSTFVDTHGERDILVKKVIPDLNRKLKDWFIMIIPIDLRWGVTKEDSANCEAIQRTCLNEVDHCRFNKLTYPFFLGLRTQRYGWVQDNLLSGLEYENPQFYEWVETLDVNQKKLAITSLECIHASLSTKKLPAAPTIFFYERNIKNFDDIEEFMRWVFQYEYRSTEELIDSSVEKQYVRKTKENVLIYAEDQLELNKWLKNLPHVKYSEYSCTYQKGGAKITGEHNGKKFAVGHVTGLEEFERLVYDDLLNAVTENFIPADLDNINEHELKNFPYEIAIRQKASTFVGRSELADKIYEHCTSAEGTNMMLVAGEPGCGKSAIISHVANKCLNNLRSNNFIFVHGVDACPQSNDLEELLLRLHNNVCLNIGTNNNLLTANDLRTKHISQLSDIAQKNPNQLFVIIVDAINQLYPDLNAWSMWWLPPEDSPRNLRIIVSSLLVENGTYINTLKCRPDALLVKVEKMTDADAEEMVTKILGKYNKRLTTAEDDAFLGNQMELLLQKNTSPLFLTAACEALRTEGIFEKMTPFIVQLPSEIQDLFDFLLDDWSDTYGAEFIRLLVCIITLSRDGLQENVISLILANVEEKRGSQFDCSFSTVYTSIRGFLSNGGGGYLHFYHDQINKVVRKKYLKSNIDFECEVQELLVGFYLDEIRSQLTDKPCSKPSVYHSDYLRHVVHHQIEAGKCKQQLPDFSETLRNIFYVKEKVMAEQGHNLQLEYLNALKNTSDTALKMVLKMWRTFSSVYAPFIKESPQWILHYVVNQVQTSPIYKDTELLSGFHGVAKTPEEFPTYWINKPKTEREDVVIKYIGGRYRKCAATSKDGNKVAVNYQKEITLFEMLSGEVFHQMQMTASISALCFSSDDTVLWVGDEEGFVHQLNITTGRVVGTCAEKIGKDDWVTWVHQVGDYIACGTSDFSASRHQGIVAVISILDNSIVKMWPTGGVGYAYCYCSGKQHFYSGHENVVRYWNMEGDMLGSVEVNGIVRGLRAHPVNENFIVCSLEYDDRKYEVVQVNTLSSEKSWPGVEASSWCRNVVYTRNGDKLICVNEDKKTIMIVNSADGSVLDHVKGHSNIIRSIHLINDNLLLSAGNDGSFLFDVPPTHEVQVEDNGRKGAVCSCITLNNSLITLSKKKDGKGGILENLNLDTSEVMECFELGSELDWRGMVAHPSNITVLLLSTKSDVVYVSLEPFNILATHSITDVNDKQNYITGTSLSSDGFICVVSTYKTGAYILNRTTTDIITKVASYDMGGGPVWCSDIHNNKTTVVLAGQKGLILWDTNTPQEFKQLRDEQTFYVRILANPGRLLYKDDNRGIKIMDLEGVQLLSFQGEHYVPSILDNPCLMVSGNMDSSLQVSDLRNGKILYKFFHHSSQGFTGFAFHEKTRTWFGVNMNGKVYVLKTSPN